MDGIFCGGVMGEFWAPSLDERKRLHELVARQPAGRVPVMAQVGHRVFSEMLDLASTRSAAASTVQHHVRRLHALPELIAELADLDDICGVKDPQGTEHLLCVQALAGDRIVVTDPSERHWLELHTEHGFQALMSTPALALYQRAGNLPIVEYTRLADSGDADGARALSDRLGPARDTFDRWMREPWLERHVIPIAQLKAWLGLVGLPQGPVRPPLVPLTRDEELTLRRDLQAAELL